MARPSIGRLLVLTLATLPLVGCASLNAYRSEAVVVESAYATIENYAEGAIAPEAVDALLEDVARLMGVTLDPDRPRVRILVTSPGRIALLAGATSQALGHRTAVALYFPGASLVMIPYFERALLGHELAHYLTEHYLSIPREEWEDVAHAVERRLLRGA